MNTQIAIVMIPVKSTQIASLGHDPETNTMAVRFTGHDGHLGSLYHYANVTEGQFIDFMKSESIGKHFGQHFKKNEAHPYTKQQ